MVLSNKKLKQKLRANLAESLTASMTQTKHSPKNSKPQSLKELIHSEILKPRLSKREKRRKTLPLPVSVRVNGSSDVSMVDTVGLEQQSDEERKKKRLNKRKADEVVENGSSISMESANLAKEMKTNTKGKTNKKKKRKNGKKVKKDEENKDSETRNGLHDLVEAVQINDDSVMNGKEVGDVATKVYVGGIPYYSSEDDIWSFFENCGTITEIDCMTFPESGKFRGIAIISFKTEAAAKRALDLDGADMGGLFLKIQPYKTNRETKATDFSPKIVEGYNRIYIGNLSWDITEDDVKKFFSDCKISSIRLGKDKETGEFRGYAHVDFSDSLSLTLALKLDQQIVCGRPVKIRCAVPKKVGESQKIDNKKARESEKTDIKIMENSKKENIKKEEEIKMENTKKMEERSKMDNINKQEESKNENVEVAVTVSSGKIKRRTCYECGEKGHLSSACPKKINS